jgi:tetratricopeptide (TPR) repeat protein
MSLLASCEKPAPVTRAPSSRETNPTLAASQLALAKNHLQSGSPEKAVTYLQAAIINGATGEAGTLLASTLDTARLTVPVCRFTHPSPVTHFTSSETSLYAAIAGSHPTVVRWDLTATPRAAAVLFPAGAKPISHLSRPRSLSRSGKYLLVHRGDVNLLCDAEALKPIRNLGTFPQGLNRVDLQPFSANSLLLAHPIASENNTLTWQIRDTATGDSLRTEKLPLYPRPNAASFEDTSLVLGLENGDRLTVPLLGKVTKQFVGGITRIVHPPQKEFTSESNTITRHQVIPHTSKDSLSPALLDAIAGYSLNPTTQSLEEIPTPNRLQTLSGHFPEIPNTFHIYSSETAVLNRLSTAFPEEFPELSAPSRAYAQIIRETFAAGDPAAISAVIRALPPSGLATSTALFLALKSGNREFIDQAFEAAQDLPPVLADIRDDRSNLTETDLALLREEQDWIGYESPNFSEVINTRRERKSSLIAKLQLPAKPTESDVQDFLAEVLSPDANDKLSREAVAEIVLTAARPLTRDPDLAASSLMLTAAAERLGSPRPAILRTRATASATLSDFKSAHRDWIDLITNQPEAAHLASDYSEAAYTAFETGDPRQAIQILNTGLFRFPNDIPFAIRAGWIALLTDHPDEALICLTRATKLGLPPSEIENTTALLAIAHMQLDDPDTAISYLAQLKAISPKWGDPETLEKLPWPEPLKESLRQLISQDQEILPEPPQENDPTDRAPLSGEFPIPEPSLPSR